MKHKLYCLPVWCHDVSYRSFLIQAGCLCRDLVLYNISIIIDPILHVCSPYCMIFLDHLQIVLLTKRQHSGGRWKEWRCFIVLPPNLDQLMSAAEVMQIM